jgi:hypothetical protein
MFRLSLNLVELTQTLRITMAVFVVIIICYEVARSSTSPWIRSTQQNLTYPGNYLTVEIETL